MYVVIEMNIVFWQFHYPYVFRKLHHYEFIDEENVFHFKVIIRLYFNICICTVPIFITAVVPMRLLNLYLYFT
mgnify:CR=1 FL=1